MPVGSVANVWEAIGQAVPDRAAQIRGGRVISWKDFDRRADGLARHFLDAGLSRQSKVAAYLYNGPEYMEAYFAAFKAGLAPVNTSYRYAADELISLFDNADAEAVVFPASFTPAVEQIRGRLPGVKTWIAVAEPGHPVPDFAVDYESLADRDVGRTNAPWGRSNDDLLILYTGGTTGMPKGVMWRQEDLFNVLGAGGNILLGLEAYQSPADAAARALSADPGACVAAPPLIHCTNQVTPICAVTPGGAAGCLPGRRVEAGSGERGLVCVSGFLPAGYYKDPEKSDRTFKMFEGRRWSVPGDFATVEADGSLKLLGRGSQVVNTGGEKVFPEEVEEAIKRYPGVRDAAVVGVPDPRFGERICAVVDIADGSAPSLGVVRGHRRQQPAGFK